MHERGDVPGLGDFHTAVFDASRALKKLIEKSKRAPPLLAESIGEYEALITAAARKAPEEETLAAAQARSMVVMAELSALRDSYADSVARMDELLRAAGTAHSAQRT